MRDHLKKHIGQKPNKCNQCDFASIRASTLRDHLKKHSGEKSNKCNQCDYASSRADSYRRRLKRHSGEKTKKCNQCEYACSDPSSLRRHLKTHSGEKSNKCNQCDFGKLEHICQYMNVYNICLCMAYIIPIHRDITQIQIYLTLHSPRDHLKHKSYKNTMLVGVGNSDD